MAPSPPTVPFTQRRDWASASQLEKVATTSPGSLIAWEVSLVFGQTAAAAPGLGLGEMRGRAHIPPEH